MNNHLKDKNHLDRNVIDKNVVEKRGKRMMRGIYRRAGERALSLVLAASMVAGSIPTNVFATVVSEEPVPGNVFVVEDSWEDQNPGVGNASAGQEGPSIVQPGEEDEWASWNDDPYN